MVSCIPKNDERRHVHGLTCWCMPRVDWVDPDTGLPWESGRGPLVIHHAADCREACEHITGEALAPGKGWRIIES